ncbi:MAG TPA: sigma-54 dependent transcriptional regulator [bacterium]|nr:sigma-54 dependent transcriptional regulator [bacterium]HQL63668.1 sigma-54 dependent transcriptional regulator [bacterium]
MDETITGSVLVVDDEAGMRHILNKLLSGKGYSVFTAESAHEALELARKDHPDIAFLDIRIPDMNGLELLTALKSQDPDLVVIMMTAFGTVETAVQAIKSGAYEYITKPFENDKILVMAANAVERRRLIDRTRRLTEEVQDRRAFEGLIGRSKSMQELYALIKRVAATESTVLIMGESGTGKEVVARAIHAQSPRADKRFVPVNCGALPRDLIESELFGHEKGAFSGAHQRRIGLVEAADRGTLFLDEIADLPADLQVKILRVIEQKEIRRVGSVTDIKVDVRLLSATNRDLEADVKSGRFREDLYYRLSIVPIRIPPLRERTEDIPLLAQHFIEQFNKKMNRSVCGTTPAAMRLLREYPWPGNVRELENTIERALVLRDQGEICEEDLPIQLRRQPPEAVNDTYLLDQSELTFQQAREAFERSYLESLLKANDNNVTRSAMLAGLSRRRLQELIKKYGLK